VVKERPDLTAQAAPNGTVTILFSDVVDSTAINERIGDRNWMRLLREHNEIIRRQKALHAGYEVKTKTARTVRSSGSEGKGIF